MDAAETVEAQVTLPGELYRAIAQQARSHGHSIGEEIAALLPPLLMPLPDDLEQELAAWEAASDEDWLALETALAAPKN